MSKRHLVLFWKGMALFGTIVFAAMLWRAKKTSDAGGASMTDAVKADLTSIISL